MSAQREVIKGEILNVWQEPGNFQRPAWQGGGYFFVWKLKILSDNRRLVGNKPRAFRHAKSGDFVEFTAEIVTMPDGKQFYKNPRKMRRVA